MTKLLSRNDVMQVLNISDTIEIAALSKGTAPAPEKKQPLFVAQSSNLLGIGSGRAIEASTLSTGLKWQGSRVSEDPQPTLKQVPLFRSPEPNDTRLQDPNHTLIEKKFSASPPHTQRRDNVAPQNDSPIAPQQFNQTSFEKKHSPPNSAIPRQELATKPLDSKEQGLIILGQPALSKTLLNHSPFHTPYLHIAQTPPTHLRMTLNGRRSSEPHGKTALNLKTLKEEGLNEEGYGGLTLCDCLLGLQKEGIVEELTLQSIR